ncbi:1-deoxy-D-xylulose-5-phosphate synthase [Saccharomonospora azurea]|uniref:1-deoxy-D-xylulose-5-phosphate synthase n=1 Tax=Saccharomonospora azurea TaxID=40988 RepID=UPI00332E9F50
MTLLESVHGPADLKRMDHDQLGVLAGEIRDFLVDKVCRAGGHLGPNLGIVEVTLAVHRVFDSPRDALLFDVGHQSYVHKIVTGRHREFDSLRQQGGIAGYPARAESEHDFIENSHASTALSYADGLAKAYQREGGGRHAVAVVGDGALTGGMCWEALNNIAADPERPVVIVVNDNGRSYSPTIGGFAEHLAALRLRRGYEKFLDGGKELLQNTPVVGKPLYTALHAAKAGIKDALSPQVMFSDLGLKYIGPVDGHDLPALEKALQNARAFGGPVVVHAVTEKGHGYAPAVNHQADQMHQTDPIDPQTGKPPAKGPSWTSVFGEELVKIGAEREDVVAITAAMLRSTGLQPFSEAYPDRWYDVGIAEQHAVASAAGLAMGGLHPVVAVYSTFLNRAFDQVLMDVALHNLPVTLVLDRAGVTGPDGPSHHGMWDLSLLGMVPGMRVAAPRDARTLREELREAVEVSDGPTALRFSRGGVVDSVPAVERVGTVDVLRHDERGDVLLVAVGAFARLGLAAAERLADQGIGVTVVDPRWVVPVPEELVALAESHRLVVTLEDSGRHGGFGSAMAATLRDADCDVPLRDLGIPQRFLEHGTRDEVLASIGLTAQDVARSVTEWAAGRLGDATREAGDVSHPVDEAMDTPRD